jgi:hypothetical protein
MSTFNLLVVLQAILQYLTAFFYSNFVVQVNVVNRCWPEVILVQGVQWNVHLLIVLQNLFGLA